MWQRQNTDSTPLTPDQLRQKAERYCAMSEHCAHDVQELLRRHGAENAVIEEIIDHLYDQHYLSDERYCRAFTNDKIRFQGWGREKVKAALMQKRLPASEIEAALAAFPQEEYMAVLQRILQKKSAQYATDCPSPSDDFPPPKQGGQGGLLRHLLSRGFTYSEIQSVSHIAYNEE